jgi:hypothetical protein
MRPNEPWTISILRHYMRRFIDADKEIKDVDREIDKINKTFKPNMAVQIQDSMCR